MSTSSPLGESISLGSTITAIGFWLGALLPFVYLPVFLLGIDSLTWLLFFCGLLALNVIALIVGHDYPASHS